MDLPRQKLDGEILLGHLENIMIHTLNEYNIDAHTVSGAPGAYVNNNKIGAIGLRVKNGYTSHGISLNVKMDLSPYSKINPCGYKDLKMCQVADFKSDIELLEVSKVYQEKFLDKF